MHRPKGFADEATPAGNGIAAQALARLGWLLGETRYLDASENTLKAGLASMTRAPQAHAAMLNALHEYLEPGEIVVIRGEPERLAEWTAALTSNYAPRRMSFAIAADGTVAYLCQGPQCSEPIEEPAALLALLNRR